jgi:glycosyltransferase involved in cell wall biosynthesis
MGTTAKYVSLEISKKHQVLFVGPPLQRKLQLLKRSWPEVQQYLRVFSGKDPDIREVNENLKVFYPKTVLESINWISNKRVYSFLHRINEKRLAKKIRDVIKRLGIKEFIVLNDTSMLIGFFLKEYLNPKLHIYLLRDAVTMAEYHSKHGKDYEPAIIRKSDLVITNSDYFAEYARQFNPNSYMIGQGCDVSMYNDITGRLAVPAELEKIPHPRIGYTGYLTTIRLDMELLIHLAENKPEWSIILVGPQDEDFTRCRLHSLKNVYHFGRKDPCELPGFIKGFDVAINPQLINEVTEVNYPLKIDEYLAMGKPVVATKTKFMSYFRDFVYLAVTKQDYVSLIEKALEENDGEKEKLRIEHANSHSWTNYADRFYARIELLFSKHSNY